MLVGNERVAFAIRAVARLESCMHDEDTEEFDPEELEVAQVRYKHAMHKLHMSICEHETVPMKELDVLVVHANERNSKLCPCGSGKRVALCPWQVQTEPLGFCWECTESIRARSDWVRVTAGPDWRHFAW